MRSTLCLLSLATALHGMAQTSSPPAAPEPHSTVPAPKPAATPSTPQQSPLPHKRPATATPPVDAATPSSPSAPAIRLAQPHPAPHPATPSTPVPKSPSAAAAPAAKPATPGMTSVPFNRGTILLDPAHGGVDTGSRITDSLLEKDVTLALAFKLSSLLTARGFTVVLTRDNDAATPQDSATPLTLDDRAGIANHAHPVACLLLHATGTGRGVHLYSSELPPLPAEPALVPWLSAQAAWVPQSRALQRQLGTALTRSEVPLILSRASVRPLDSLTCPALVLELAPRTTDNSSISDADYQQRVTNAVASALVFWQTAAQPPERQLPPPPAPSHAPTSTLGPATIPAASPPPSTTPRGAQP